MLTLVPGKVVVNRAVIDVAGEGASKVRVLINFRVVVGD